MTAADLRRAFDRFNGITAARHLSMLRNQKKGYTFTQVFSQQPEILQAIVLKALVAANAHTADCDPIAVPAWASLDLIERIVAKSLSL